MKTLPVTLTCMPSYHGNLSATTSYNVNLSVTLSPACPQSFQSPLCRFSHQPSPPQKRLGWLLELPVPASYACRRWLFPAPLAGSCAATLSNRLHRAWIFPRKVKPETNFSQKNVLRIVLPKKKISLENISENERSSRKKCQK